MKGYDFKNIWRSESHEKPTMVDLSFKKIFVKILSRGIRSCSLLRVKKSTKKVVFWPEI